MFQEIFRRQFKASNPGNNALLIQNPSNGIIGFGANNQTNQVIITADGHLSIPVDSKQLRLGAGDDLRLEHDGSTSYISNYTGNLHFRTVSNETSAIFIPNGAVELYHNNSKKLETTSSGTDITGNLNATGNIRATGNGSTISVGDNNDLFITHTNNGLIDNNTGDLTIQTQNAMQLKLLMQNLGFNQ